MPFVKEWDSKPKVSVYPFRRNNGVLCHNCWTAWPKEMLNVCTGLCTRCVEENPVPIQEVQSSSSRPEGSTCRKCPNKVYKTNIGIPRDVCHKCKNDNHPLKQRCLACDSYFNDCWNNICRRCRYQKFLCDKVGNFYRNEDAHQEECFCLSHEEQLVRQLQKSQSNNTT